MSIFSMAIPETLTVFPVTAFGWVRRFDLDEPESGREIWERPNGHLMRMKRRPAGMIPSIAIGPPDYRARGPNVPWGAQPSAAAG